MSESKSVAVVYRTLQSISDLRAVAERASDATLARVTAGISSGGAEGHLRRTIFQDRCLLDGPKARNLHLALVLAATLPDDDHEAFVLATAILLADRLQAGGGSDDLFWHWDAFNDHYRLIAPPARAVIMNGYRRAHEDRRVVLVDPPEGADLCTEPFGKMVALARAMEPSDLKEMLVAALTLGETDPVADWWEDSGRTFLTAPSIPVLRVLRHIYECTSDWSPFEGRLHQADGNDAHVLPFLPG